MSPIGSGFADRSWLLRGQVHPSPWGRSVAPWLENVEITFSRRRPADDGYGGTKGGVATSVWVTRGNVQRHDQRRKDPVPEGPSAHAKYEAIVRNPVDATFKPRKGDKATFVDTWGVQHDTYIEDVGNPGEEFDHLEIMLEEQV